MNGLTMRLRKHPGWCGSVDWVPACEPKCCQFDSQSGHMPGLQARSPWGGTREATTHWCFSPCVSPSFPLSLKINKWNPFKKCLQFLNIDFTYPAILPNSLTILSSFLVEKIGFSMYTIMSSTVNDSFTSSFPVWMPFTSLSCLITVVCLSKCPMYIWKECIFCFFGVEVSVYIN